MTDSPLDPSASVEAVPADTSVLTRSRRGRRRRDEPGLRRRRAGAAPVPRLSDRRSRRARQVRGRREPAVDRRLGSGPPPPHGARPARRPGRPAGVAARRRKPMDALRTAVSAWGATQALSWPPTVGAGQGPDRVLAVGAGRVHADPCRHGSDRARSLARAGGRLPVPADGLGARARHRSGARRVLHRRRGARLQRLHLHGPGHHLDPVGHRVGGHRGDRDDEGAAPRRRPVGGRRPAGPGRLGRSCRGLGSRRRWHAASG